VTGRRMLLVRRLAVALAALAVAVLTVLDRTIGYPRSPEAGPIPEDLQATIQHALLLAAALAVVLAIRAPAVGGIVLAVCALALGVSASLQYHPLIGVVPYAVLVVPAAVLVALRIGSRPRPLAVLAVVFVGVSAVGAVAAQEVHAYFYGPTHPVSDVELAPAVDVEWAWTGGVGATTATTKAGLAGEEPRAARLVVARDAALTAPTIVDGTVAMAGERPVATFTMRDLEPGRAYWYAVEVDGRVDNARRGRFRTFPDGAGSFTVAIGGCARIGSNGRVFDAMRAQDPDLVLLLGDLYYGNVGVGDVDRFRRHLERVVTRPAQSELYRGAPIAYVWDDHDYGPDGADGTSVTRGPARQAYGELVPSYDLPAGDDGPIYQAFTIGRVRFLVTDLRSARSPADAPDGPGKSMLGAAQKAWLERELIDAAARYALTVVVSSVPWIGEPSAGADGWAGYAHERAELGGFMTEHGIDNVLMLAGDAHMVAIDDGSHTSYGGGPAFPLMHSAALDQLGSTKGGPYSEGTHPGSGQFGTLEVEDDGRRLAVTLTGRRWNGDVLARHRYEIDS
jgi:hypothetical protein